MQQKTAEFKAAAEEAAANASSAETARDDITANHAFEIETLKSEYSRKEAELLAKVEELEKSAEIAKDGIIASHSSEIEALKTDFSQKEVELMAKVEQLEKSFEEIGVAHAEQLAKASIEAEEVFIRHNPSNNIRLTTYRLRKLLNLRRLLIQQVMPKQSKPSMQL